MTDAPSSRGDSKLLLRRRPLDVGRSPVNAEDDERGLPDALVIERPNVGVAILRAGDDPVGVRRPINGRDELVVLRDARGSILFSSGAVDGREREEMGGGRTSASVTEWSKPPAPLRV